MCFTIQSPITQGKPDITFYEIDSKQVETELNALNIRVPLGLWDYGSPYYYTTLWGLQQAIDWVRKIYKFPTYEMPRRDCDDFAVLMKGLIGSEFGINAFGIAVGGGHAFCISRVADRWVNIEPQNGKIFELDFSGYTVDYTVQ